MATLLPLAEQQFCDGDGSPYAGGQVFFYVPGTTTPKDTWADPGQQTLNRNPVILDANGRAVIYGEGSYRQVLKDSDLNVIWDQVTAATDSAQASWAGTAGGTANNIVLTAINFSSVDGQAIDFLALLTNTGPAQATVNGVAIPLKLDTLSGPVQTPAGCVVAGDRYRVTYDATAGLLHLTPLVDKGYVDAGDAASVAGAASAAQGYASAAQSAAQSYAAQQASAAQNAAEGYAAQQASAAQNAAEGYASNAANAAQNAAQSFATNADAAVLSTAETYAANQAGTAFSNAQTYTNNHIAAAQGTNAATYLTGVRLSGFAQLAASGRSSGMVCTGCGSASGATYAYIQYCLNGTWVNIVDA